MLMSLLADRPLLLRIWFAAVSIATLALAVYVLAAPQTESQ
ncbi:hypothetical protein [Nonomuraea insulae]|uniref:Sensor histidine kinase n=1 Tax=Nonomuraea insulae TaxID=1616787 RepID=A0ABW1D2I6_9ACTN